jgi:hypothetical protein
LKLRLAGRFLQQAMFEVARAKAHANCYQKTYFEKLQMQTTKNTKNYFCVDKVARTLYIYSGDASATRQRRRRRRRRRQPRRPLAWHGGRTAAPATAATAAATAAQAQRRQRKRRQSAALFVVCCCLFRFFVNSRVVSLLFCVFVVSLR